MQFKVKKMNVPNNKATFLEEDEELVVRKKKVEQ